MGTPLSAGVYLREIDLSEIVPALATSVGAIVGASKKGPIDRPYLVTNTKQFLDMFGTPDPKVSYMHYAALAFLEQSNQLWVRRAAGTGYTYSGLLMQKLAADSANKFTALAHASPLDVDFTTAGTGTLQENLAYFYAIGPGSYGASIKLGIVSANLKPPTTVSCTTATTGGSLGAALATSYKVTAVNSIGETIGSTAATVTTGAGTTNKVTVTWTAVTGAISYKVYGRTSGSELYLATTTDLSFVDTGLITPAGAIPVASATTDEFKLQVFDTTVSAVVPQEEFVVSLSTKLDGFGKQMELETVVNNQSNLFRVVSNVGAITGTLPTIYSVAATALAAGDSGAAVTNSQIVLAWQDFKDVEKITVRILINGGYTSPTVQLAMDAVCHCRGDCVAVLDLPSDSNDPTRALNYRTTELNLNSNRSALYGPDLKINDPYNDLVLHVPPSGHVAGTYAKTDYVSNVWFAPAGLNRGRLSILGLKQQYTAGERDLLAPNQINYVRNFPGQGMAVWEQKTLQAKTSALSYVNVRRMLDMIEVSIQRALQFSVFEPNDDLLRMQIVTMIAEFLETIRRGRGINKYLVVSDASNNPPVKVGQGILQVDVYIEPTLPAEKILLVAVLTKQGADFNELVARNVTA